MFVSSVAAPRLLAAVIAMSALPTLAEAGSWNPIDVRRAEAAPVIPSATKNTDNACVWSSLRGWHRTGWSGWKSCMPGPEWRYQNRCWIGPGNEKHCRFYG